MVPEVVVLRLLDLEERVEPAVQHRAVDRELDAVDVLLHDGVRVRAHGVGQLLEAGAELHGVLGAADEP